jgi:hypothetical protein
MQIITKIHKIAFSGDENFVPYIALLKQLDSWICIENKFKKCDH